jgi:hypothetical protein
MGDIRSFTGVSGAELRYVELEDCNQVCKHCGVKMLAQTLGLLGYLGSNVSFFCDPNDLSKGHEPQTI